MTRKPKNAAEDALARNMLRIRTEGLDAATDAAISLLRDPKAPAQAKSATVNAIYRANGLFGSSARDEDDLEPHEMTAEQLERSVRRIERGLNKAVRADPAADMLE